MPPKERAVKIFVSLFLFCFFHLYYFNNDFTSGEPSIPERDTFFWEVQVSASQRCTFIQEVRIVCQVIRIRPKLSDPVDEEAV